MPNFNDFYKKLAQISRQNYTVTYYAEKKGIQGLITITRIITFYETRVQSTVHKLSLPHAIADYLLRALYLK